jgi:ribose transport system substrate-binding protein
VGSKSKVKQRSLGKYFVPVASKTLDVLEAFRSPHEELTLEQIITRTGVAHTTAFRILYTLVHRGYLNQTAQKRYRLNPRPRRIRIGFATLSLEQPFAVAVTESLSQASVHAGFELIVRNNRQQAQAAIENAQELVTQGIDIAIEFQADEEVAPVIADIYARAGIRTIAVGIPQPGAVFFGVDNYRAGWTAGVALAQHALSHWGGKLKLLILLDLPSAGPVVQARMTGVLRGIQHGLGGQSPEAVVRVDGKGTREASAQMVAAILADHPGIDQVAVSAVNDPSALGALDAVRGADISSVAIVGHGCSVDAWPEILDPNSPYLGSVAFFPERYGPGLVDVIVRMLKGEFVEPVHYVPHQMIDRHNFEQHYRLPAAPA